MALSLKSALTYCRDQCWKHDYEMYLCSLFLPERTRLLGWTLRAFNLEIAQARVSSMNPEIAINRLVFWRNFVGDYSNVQLSGSLLLA